MKRKNKIISSGILMSIFSKVYGISPYDTALLYGIPDPEQYEETQKIGLSTIIGIISIPVVLILGIIATLKVRKSDKKYLKIIVPLIFICIIIGIIVVDYIYGII